METDASISKVKKVQLTWKSEETSDRPDLLCLMGTGTPWTRLKDPHFCEHKRYTLKRLLIQNILAEGF